MIPMNMIALKNSLLKMHQFGLPKRMLYQWLAEIVTSRRGTKKISLVVSNKGTKGMIMVHYLPQIILISLHFVHYSNVTVYKMHFRLSGNVDGGC